MSSESAPGSPAVKAGEMRLEVVVVPVSDVDRAKRFSESLGWRLDADLAVDDGYRVVQLTPANYEAVPRVVYTDPQAAAVGADAGRFGAMVPLSEVPKTAIYTRAYADQNGFLTLLSDGERLTGAYALGPEAGEWLQQATLAVRAHIPFDVLADTIRPFPTFSEIYVAALKALRGGIAAASKAVGTGPPMAS